MSIKILSKDEFVPSTVTMVSNFNLSINPMTIARFLPVVHLFNKKTGKRLKLDSGTRTSISYYGFEGIIISVCYKKIRRGMRTGAMNNMVSMDLQYTGKNIHIKLSSNTITSVGTSDFKQGVEVFELMIRHINILNSNIRYLKNSTEEIVGNNLKWMLTNCVDETGFLISVNNMLKKIKSLPGETDLDTRILKTFTVYLDDFDRDCIEPYKEKITNFSQMSTSYEGVLECMRPSIFNSVYHIDLFNDMKNSPRIPLHKISPYLANKGFVVEFHNWTSEGVNICFDIEEEKRGLQHRNKEYRHRFTIHERGTIRQCSPTFKDESYKYYFGVIKQIERFFQEENISDEYKKYIKNTIE